jgi:allantoinase
MPSFDLIIRNGTLVRETSVARGDIAVEDGQIVQIVPELFATAREIIDADGLHVFAGMIDPHVHFNEPGRTDWEGIATGSAALAAGGGTCFFDMPLNSAPPVLSGDAFDEKRRLAEHKSLTDFALWGGLTPLNLHLMDELAARGVVGFKAFMCNSGIDEFPRVDDLTLLEGMQRAARLGLPVAVHAENETITAGLTRRAMLEGRTTARDFLASRPPIAELEAIERAIAFAAETKCALHVVHVSTGAGAAAVFAARENDVDVTCETCPHYLLLSDADAAALGPVAKCAPPLRSSGEVQGLWTQLAGDEIDFVASDHSPSPPHMKQTDNWFNAWGGIAGCQTTLEALLAAGFEQDRLTLQRITELTSWSVARRFNLPNKGRLAPGYDADLTIADLAAGRRLEPDDLLYRYRVTPYLRHPLNLGGRVQRTLVRGRTVFLNGQVTFDPRGRLIKPDRKERSR